MTPDRMEAAPRGPKTILIIDDEAKVRGAIAVVLEGAGFRTLEANNGSEAIHLFAERFRELTAATLDLDMPTTNGRETLAMLSAYAPTLPIVVVTGWPIDDLVGRTPGTRGVGYVQKPFTPDQLMAELRRMIAESAPPEGSSA